MVARGVVMVKITSRVQRSCCKLALFVDGKSGKSGVTNTATHCGHQRKRDVLLATYDPC